MIAALALACLVASCAHPAAAASFEPRHHSLTVMDPDDGAHAYDATFGNGNWKALAPYVDMFVVSRPVRVPDGMRTALYADAGMCSGTKGPGHNDYAFPDCSDWPADAFYAQPGHSDRLLTAREGTILQRAGNPAAPVFRHNVLDAIRGALRGADAVDLAYLDDTGPPDEGDGGLCWGTPSFEPGAHGCDGAPGGEAAPPYGPTATQGWLNGMRTLIADMPRPVVLNGIGGVPKDRPSSMVALIAQTPNVWGGVCDGCFYGYQDVPTNKFLWSGPVLRKRLDAAIAVTAAGKNVIMVNAAVTDPAARTRALADIMLAYDPDRTWFWYAVCGQRSRIHVCPEAALSFYKPVHAYPHSAADEEAEGGVLVRAFGACYDAGRPAGPCATVVNPDPYEPHALPQTLHAYAHTLRVSGLSLCVCYGDRGSVDLSGPAPPAQLPPGSGYVLFR
jgi:hypothetical protein